MKHFEHKRMKRFERLISLFTQYTQRLNFDSSGDSSVYFVD